MHQLIDTGLNDMFREDTKVQSRLPELARRVQQGEVSTLTAAQELLNAFRKG
jgi:hypothetical protein